MNKYLIRKVLFVAALGLAIYAPIGVTAYQSRNTTDPYIIMARDIERWDKGIDVLKVWDNPGVLDGLAILVNIAPYPEWPSNTRENFTRYLLEVTRGGDRGESEWTALEVAIGWDYPSEAVRVQMVIICTDLRATSCTSEQVAGFIVHPDLIDWPGIGNP